MTRILFGMKYKIRAILTCVLRVKIKKFKINFILKKKTFKLFKTLKTQFLKINSTFSFLFDVPKTRVSIFL